MKKPDWTTKEFREPYWQQAKEILAAYSEERKFPFVFAAAPEYLSLLRRQNGTHAIFFFCFFYSFHWVIGNDVIFIGPLEKSPE